MEQFSLLYLLRLGKKNLNFVYTGGWIGNFMQVRHAGLREKIRTDRRRCD
jgi:hypothetical protein